MLKLYCILGVCPMDLPCVIWLAAGVTFHDQFCLHIVFASDLHISICLQDVDGRRANLLQYIMAKRAKHSLPDE